MKCKIKYPVYTKPNGPEIYKKWIGQHNSGDFDATCCGSFWECKNWPCNYRKNLLHDCFSFSADNHP